MSANGEAKSAPTSNCWCETFDNKENKAPGPLQDIMCVNVGDVGEGRNCFKLTIKKGWAWRDKMRPIANTQWCEKSHFGVLLKGKLKVDMKDKDGNQLETKEFN